MEMGVFRDMQNKVGTEFSIVTMPMNVDYFYKNFYKQERELSLFCYLPPIHNRRSNTEQFSRYISEKYNIKYIDRDVEAYRTQSQTNPNEFKLRDSTFNIQKSFLIKIRILILWPPKNIIILNTNLRTHSNFTSQTQPIISKLPILILILSTSFNINVNYF